MLTRTSAADYQASGDPHEQRSTRGWVTDEDPRTSRRAEDRRARLPALHSTIVDGAARNRRSDHRRLQHRQPRVGRVPQGLPARSTGSGASASWQAASAPPLRAARDPKPVQDQRHGRRGDSDRRGSGVGARMPESTPRGLRPKEHVVDHAAKDVVRWAAERVARGRSGPRRPCRGDRRRGSRRGSRPPRPNSICTPTTVLLERLLHGRDAIEPVQGWRAPGPRAGEIPFGG